MEIHTDYKIETTGELLNHDLTKGINYTRSQIFIWSEHLREQLTKRNGLASRHNLSFVKNY